MHVKFFPSHMAGQDSDPIIKIYLREIMETPLLTPQEEIELAARIKKGDQGGSGFDDQSKPPTGR